MRCDEAAGQPIASTVQPDWREAGGDWLIAIVTSLHGDVRGDERCNPGVGNPAPSRGGVARR